MINPKGKLSDMLVSNNQMNQSVFWIEGNS